MIPVPDNHSNQETRDGSRVCIPSGNDFNFLQWKIVICVKFEAHSPPLAKDTKLGHSLIRKKVGEVRSWWDPSDTEKDSRFSLLDIEKYLSFV